MTTVGVALEFDEERLKHWKRQPNWEERK